MPLGAPRRLINDRPVSVSSYWILTNTMNVPIIPSIHNSACEIRMLNNFRVVLNLNAADIYIYCGDVNARSYYYVTLAM